MPNQNVHKPITHARHTIEVESYTDIDGCRKFSISSGGTTHHYLPDEFEEISIADALHNLLDPIAYGYWLEGDGNLILLSVKGGSIMKFTPKATIRYSSNGKAIR